MHVCACVCVSEFRCECVKQICSSVIKMPLFGKKDSKKSKKESKDVEKVPSVDDKYNLKELLGT